MKDEWFELLAYVVPVAALVYDQCKSMGLAPMLPIVGLALGIVLEMKR